MTYHFPKANRPRKNFFLARRVKLAGRMADRQYKSAMEDEEIKRRGDMHKELLSMNLCPELSEEAAIKIGVGSIEIGIDFCFEEETRVRVRSEHKVVIQKTGLRSQGAKAASLRGLGASPPADLLSVAAAATGGKRGADANVERRSDGALYTA